MIELEARQDFFMADAAPRILVHDVDELLDRVLAVTDDMTGHALRRGHQFAVHDQQSVVIPFEITLDDDVASVFPRFLERNLDFFGCLEIDRHATPVIAGQRF